MTSRIQFDFDDRALARLATMQEQIQSMGGEILSNIPLHKVLA